MMIVVGLQDVMQRPYVTVYVTFGDISIKYTKNVSRMTGERKSAQSY